MSLSFALTGSKIDSSSSSNVTDLDFFPIMFG